MKCSVTEFITSNLQRESERELDDLLQIHEKNACTHV